MTTAPLPNQMSEYEAHGMKVSMYWHVDGRDATLKAHVQISGEPSRHDMLTEAETRYIIRAAAKAAIATGEPDHKHYARIYWGMIL